jgi:hypothetical protein
MHSFKKNIYKTAADDETQLCLANMEIILRYSESGAVGIDGLTPICYGGHTCDMADFVLSGNGIPIGPFTLNNINGPLDQHNYPPGVFSGYDRYNSLTLDETLSAQIAALSDDGFIDFKIDPAEWNTTPHTGITWIIFKLNGEIKLQTCKDTTGFRVNPCTGEALENRDLQHVTIGPYVVQLTNRFYYNLETVNVVRIFRLNNNPTIYINYYITGITSLLTLTLGDFTTLFEPYLASLFFITDPY